LGYHPVCETRYLFLLLDGLFRTWKFSGRESPGGGAIVDQVCYTIDVFNMSCSRSASKEDKS